MANNKIQIKRSVANGVVTGLSNGELAFTQASNTLWIGLPDGSATIAIAAARNPGILTANASLVANSTSGINRILAANVDLSILNANGAAGTAGWVLFSGGGTTNSYWASTGALSTNTAAAYTWTNTHIFQGNSTAASFLTVGANLVMNTISFGFTGNTTTSPTITIANSGAVSIGNSTVTAPSVGITVANTVGTTTISAGSINTTNITGTLQTVSQPNITANNTSFLGGVAAASYVQNTDSRVLSGNLTFSGANTTLTGANTTVTGTNTFLNATGTNIGGTTARFTSNVIVTSANIDATSATLAVRDINVSGNLIVTGTMTAVDSTTLVAKDSMIKLADQQDNTATFADALDVGFYGAAGNTSAHFYAGLARIASLSTNTNPFFALFSTATEPTTTITGQTYGTLRSFLAPYGTGGAFIANATNISITANSTLAVALTANTLSLTTALAGTSGGTGLATFTTEDILVANSTNGFRKLGIGTDGYVLQSSGGALVYNTLDGGTF